MKEKDSARYLLDAFLNSENSYNYDLDAVDLSILYAITYFIDCDKNGRNACCAKQTTLAVRARVTRETVYRRLPKLKELGLIEMERKWKLWWITPGLLLLSMSENNKNDGENSSLQHLPGAEENTEINENNDDQKSIKRLSVSRSSDCQSHDQATVTLTTIEYKKKNIRENKQQQRAVSFLNEERAKAELCSDEKRGEGGLEDETELIELQFDETDETRKVEEFMEMFRNG